MLQGMDQSEFGEFVAALWERHGWRAQVKRDDGRVFVAVQRPETAEEGLLWAIAEEEIGGKQVQQFASVCEEYDVAQGAVVTTGRVSDHAEKVAAGTSVELLGGHGFSAVLKRDDLADFAAQYGADGAAGADDGDDSPLGRLRAAGERGSSLVSGLVDATAGTVSGLPLVVVVVVALLGAGVLFGPSVPGFGGGDGGPVSAASVSPADGDASLRVAWNARVVDSIDPNESDEVAYYPPDGERFVVVKMSIDNTGERKVDLKQVAFVLRTDERTYGYQPLADHDGFLDFSLSPGQQYVGWTVFTVPAEATATLTYDQNATDPAVAVEFERDPDLPVDVTPQ